MLGSINRASQFARVVRKAGCIYLFILRAGFKNKLWEPGMWDAQERTGGAGSTLGGQKASPAELLPKVEGFTGAEGGEPALPSRTPPASRGTEWKNVDNFCKTLTALGSAFLMKSFYHLQKGQCQASQLKVVVTRTWKPSLITRILASRGGNARPRALFQDSVFTKPLWSRGPGSHWSWGTQEGAAVPLCLETAAPALGHQEGVPEKACFVVNKGVLGRENSFWKRTGGWTNTLAKSEGKGCRGTF